MSSELEQRTPVNQPRLRSKESARLTLGGWLVITGILIWVLDLLGFLARAHGRTRRAGGVRELRSRPLVLISRWRYTAIGWLMWRLWKRRLRRKVIYALLRKVGLV